MVRKSFSQMTQANTSADENRELVTIYLPDLVSCLERKELIATAVLVIMNLCNDYGWSYT